jgi:hypothetical protein
MALLYGISAQQQSSNEDKPHTLSFLSARSSANKLLLDVLNGPTTAARKAAVDLNGKYYSAALTAGDILYAVAGGVTGVKRLDSLAIGAANTVLQSSGTVPQWASTLAGLTLASPTITGTLTATGVAITMGALTATTGTFSGGLLSGSLTAYGVTIGGNNDVTFTSTYGLVVGATRVLALTATGATFANAVSMGALTATTGAFSALLSANAGLTVTSGQTLTLTGATITGAPTWSSAQVMNVTGNVSGSAATVTGAAQAAITSVGTLTALAIGAGSTTNALVVTTTGAINSAFQYDGSNHLDLKNSSTGAVTLDAVGTNPRYTFRVGGTVLVTLVGTTTTLVGTLAMPAAITGSPAWASLAGSGSRTVVADANGVLSAP